MKYRIKCVIRSLYDISSRHILYSIIIYYQQDSIELYSGSMPGYLIIEIGKIDYKKIK